tara:strand:+ start:150 stop:1139 length:990 start_codon:yes stop_codon:yes gene_type:complete
MINKVNKILITGGAGYIGSHVAEKLVKTKCKIVIVDNLQRGSKKLINKKTNFIKADINNTKKLRQIILKKKIDTIIHLASFASVAESQKFKKKYYLNNVIGTQKLLQACKNTNIKNFIYSSSCSIYGNVKGKVSETKKPNPKSYYAFTKYKSENLIKNFSKKYKFKYVILRYFNVAGASNSGKIGEIGNRNDRLIKNLAIQFFKRMAKINIHGTNYKTKDGTCIRDYIHVSDIADIHNMCIGYLNKNFKSNTFNCGYEKGYSVLEISKIFKKLKKNTIIKFGKRRPGDVGQVFANSSKFKKIFKWKPKYNDIKKILYSSIKWEKKLNHL